MVHLLQPLLEAMDVDLAISLRIEGTPQLLQSLIALFFCLPVHLPSFPQPVICAGSSSAGLSGSCGFGSVSS